MAGGTPPRVGVTLPVVPAPQYDELISSWLDRTARFYAVPVQDLLARAYRPPVRADLATIDLGTSRASLVPVAALLGITVEQIKKHTIIAAYPWSAHLLARDLYVPSGQNQPNLRYAACGHCLEQQKIEHGFSWLRREWVIAAKTVCSSHHVILREQRGSMIVHPVWEDYQRKHGVAWHPVCSIYPRTPARAVSAESPLNDGLVERLHRKTMIIQDLILTAAAQGKKVHTRTGLDDIVCLVGDLVWAFTRADRHCADRLVYEAFSSDLLENNRVLAQRRKSGPVDFTRLHVEERYTMLATATLLLTPKAFREQFYYLPSGWHGILATFRRRMADSDWDKFLLCQRRWLAGMETIDPGSDIDSLIERLSNNSR